MLYDSTFSTTSLGLVKAIRYMCGYTQFLTRTSTWEILSFIFHIRKCCLLQDFSTRFHRFQIFFPNDPEPHPHSTSGSTHMKTDSCLTLHVFTHLLNSTQPHCRAFLFIAYNPLSASSLHPLYHEVTCLLLGPSGSTTARGGSLFPVCSSVLVF